MKQLIETVIVTGDQSRAAWIHPSVPGLAISPRTGSEREWSVLHVRSGLAAGNVPSRFKAHRGLLALAGIADWTVCQDELCRIKGIFELINKAITRGKVPQLKQKHFWS